MRTTPDEIRDRLLRTLQHVGSAFGKLVENSGPRKPLSPPDLHKTTEGLFLSAWTYWEQFLRELFILDLATDPNSKLLKEVKARGFRRKRSNLRLAEMLVDHPDDDKWVDWSSIDVVRNRAAILIGSEHRFMYLSQHQLDAIRQLKRIRNAVAHRSDKAWSDFRRMVRNPPFSLSPNSMKGITPGRFLAAHQVGGQAVFSYSIGVLRQAASTLVP